MYEKAEFVTSPRRANRLLIVTDDYWPNLDGGALFERRLAIGMVLRGHEVTVLAPSLDGSLARERDRGTTIVRVPSRILRSNPRYRISRWSRVAAKVLIDFQPTVVHVHNPGPLGVLALLAARRTSTIAVATNHMHSASIVANSHLRRVPGLISEPLVWRYITGFLNRFAFVASPSRFADRLLLSHGLTVPHGVITNGVAISDFAAAPRTQEAPDLRLLYVGRLDYEKNVDLLIRAAGLASREVRISLAIVGEGLAEHSLRSLADETMLSHRSVAIDFLGRVDEAVKPAIFQQSDLVCVPSSVELQSVVALEAFAARRPVLAASVGALTELVVHGRTGSLFSPNDVLDLAAKIREFGQMPRKQRTTMAFAAAAEVQELHSNTLMLDGYSSLYARIAAQK